MSKADEMFNKLGFKKIEDTDTEVVYEYNATIMGDKLTHTILIAKIGKIIFSYHKQRNERRGIGMQELQAINEKVKELNWNV